MLISDKVDGYLSNSKSGKTGGAVGVDGLDAKLAVESVGKVKSQLRGREAAGFKDRKR